jgi:hypothetical protein
MHNQIRFKKINLQVIFDHFVLVFSSTSFFKNSLMVHSTKIVVILLRHDDTELKTALNKQAKNKP